MMDARKRRNTATAGCCSVTFIKWILIAYTFLLFVEGACVVGVSLWTLFDRHQYVSLLTSITYPMIIYLLLGAGILLIVVSILGICGVTKENRICLILYIILLLLIFVTEVMVGIVSYAYRVELHNILELNLNDNFVTSYGINTPITEAVDFLQTEFKCCGILTYEDWNGSYWYQDGLSNLNLVPDSCCISATVNCGRRIHPSNIYYEGCMEVMEDHLKEHLNIICAVGLGICILQIFGVIYAFVLYCKLPRHQVRITGKRKHHTQETQALFA